MPLVIWLAWLIPGIVLGDHLAFQAMPAFWPALTAIAVWGAAGVFRTVAGVHGHRPYRPGVKWGVLFLGIALGSTPYSAEKDPLHISRFFHLKTVTVTGRVATFFPQGIEDRLDFQLNVDAAGKGGKHDPMTSAHGVLRVVIRGMPPVISYGDTLRLRGGIRAFRSFANPGGFDYARFMKRQGIDGSLYLRTGNVTVLEAETPPGAGVRLIRNIADFRRHYIAFLDKQVEDPRVRALVRALVTGDKSLLDTGLKAVFSRTGAAHLLAVSGLHLSIVAWVCYSILKSLLGVCHALLIRGLHRKWGAVLTLVPLAGYAFIAGGSPATQRAWVMAAVVMTALVAERENAGLNALALAGILILAADPASLFSLSFQLSFCAVLFILQGLELLRKRKWVQGYPPILIRLILFFLVSVLAIAGTQPLVMRGFHLVSFAGPLTNLATIPTIGFGVLPLGLAALVLFPFFPAIAASLLTTAQWLGSGCIGFLEWTAAFPWTWRHTISPGLDFFILWYGGLVGVYLMLDRHIKQGVLLTALSVTVGICGAAVDIHHRFFNREMQVTVLDVGQGSAALVQMPAGSCFLIDGGGFARTSSFDTGRYLVGPFLWGQNILSLDGVILSHPESDHMNGLLYILEHFHVATLYKNRDSRKLSTYRELMALARLRGTRVEVVPEAGTDIRPAGGGRLIFFPGPGDQGRRGDYNHRCLVLKAEHGGGAVLLAGDITADREADLVRNVKDRLRSEILLVPHHGSGSSSSPAFLSSVAPSVAVVSCGWHNRFGFPHETVLERFRFKQIPVFRTDLHGAVRIAFRTRASRPDGTGFIIRTCRP